MGTDHTCPGHISLPSLRQHTGWVKEQKHTDLVIIRSGVTSRLQPLDVSINKPLQQGVRKHYDARLGKNNHIYTPMGKQTEHQCQ
jgi:hypothetical protein